MPVGVPFVSVRFGEGRAEELAYRDGGFVHPYELSTRTADTFALRRIGGWPSTPTVFVEEAAGPITTFWTTLYEKDLRTLPSGIIGAGYPTNIPGSGNANLRTIDGRSWRMHTPGPSSDPWTIMAINGLGIRMVTNQMDNGYSGLYLTLLYTDIPGYDASKMTAVQVRGSISGFSSTHHVFGATTWNGALGFGSPSAVGNMRANCQSGGVRAVELRTGTTWPAYVPPTNTSGDWVFAVTDSPAGQRKSALFGAFNGQLPAMEEMVPLGTYTDNASAPRSMGFYAGGSYFNPISVDVTHIRVLQRSAVGAAP